MFLAGRAIWDKQQYESLIKSLITASELRLVYKQNSKAKPGKNHTDTLGDCLNHDPTWTHTVKPVGFSNMCCL